MARNGAIKRTSQLMDGLGIGKDALECFEFLRDVMRGVVRDPLDPSRYLIGTMRERIDAAMWLAEKRTGRAPQQIDVAIEDNRSGARFDYARLTDAELAALENLHQKAGIVDGEIIPDVRPIQALPAGANGGDDVSDDE